MSASPWSGSSSTIGGSVASTFSGEPRATLDADIVVDLPLPKVGDFVSELGDEVIVDPRSIRDEIARHGSFQIVHLPTLTRIDVFVP
ncbi:MAG: hypothetical protein IPM29_26410 [Planctomycetes bacterium]|nr:hypothetical protein [Planctomycetota bacterium]